MAGMGLEHSGHAGVKRKPLKEKSTGSPGRNQLTDLNREVFLIVNQQGRCDFLNPAIRKMLRIDEINLGQVSQDLLQNGGPVLLEVEQEGGEKLLLKTRFSRSFQYGQIVFIACLDDTQILSDIPAQGETDALPGEYYYNTLALMDHLDAGNVLQTILMQAITFFRTAHGLIALADENGDGLKRTCSHGVFSGDLIVLPDEEVGLQGFMKHVWQTGVAAVVNDASSSEWHSERQGGADMKAALAVPVVMGDRVAGVIGMAYDDGRRFEQTDIDSLQRFARQVSMVLINLHQVNQMQYEMAAHEAYEVRLHTQSRLLAGAADALKSLIVSQSVDQAVRDALSFLGEASQVSRIYVFENFSQEEDDELQMGLLYEWERETRNIQVAGDQQHTISYEPDMLEWKATLEQGKTVTCYRNASTENRHTLLNLCHVQSLLLVPILIGDLFWGVMGFGDDQSGRKWQQEEYAILAAAAAGLGTVIEHRKVEDVLLATEERFKAFMDNSPLLVYIRDDQGRYLFINEKFRRIQNLPKDSFVERTADELFSKEVAYQFMEGEQEVLAEGRMQEMEYMHALPDGSLRHWREAKFPVDGPAGSRYVGGIIQDVTERIMAQEELKRWAAELERRNRELAMLSQMNKFLQACVRPEAAYSVLVEYARQLFPNVSGMLLMHTENGTRLYPAAWWGDEIDSDLSIPVEECPAFLQEEQRQMNGSDFAGAIEKCDMFPWSDVQTRLCLPILAQEQAFEQARVVGVMCMWDRESGNYIYQNQRQLAMTLSEQIGLTLSNLNLSTRLRQQAIRDPLTGLFNRRYLYETLERELKRAERDGQETSILMIDLDHFKKVNDTYGHATGDDALRHIGAILRQSVRGSDIACRYGGEEFVLALLNAGLEDAENRAHQILSLVRKLSLTVDADTTLSITVSIGVATFPQHGKNTDTLLSAADAAMYRAKQQGRDCVVISDRQEGEGGE